MEARVSVGSREKEQTRAAFPPGVRAPCLPSPLPTSGGGAGDETRLRALRERQLRQVEQRPVALQERADYGEVGTRTRAARRSHRRRPLPPPPPF